MAREALVITIDATIARGSLHPASAQWRVIAQEGDSPEATGAAITEACRQLHAVLREQVK